MGRVTKGAQTRHVKFVVSVIRRFSDFQLRQRLLDCTLFKLKLPEPATSLIPHLSILLANDWTDLLAVAHRMRTRSSQLCCYSRSSSAVQC